MVETFLKLFGREGFQAQAATNATGDRQQISAFQASDQTMVAGKDDGKDGTGVQLGAGEQAQFREDGAVHFLAFIDDEDRSVDGRLDVSEPFFPEDFGAVPEVVRGQGYGEELSQFPSPDCQRDPAIASIGAYPR